MKKAKTPRNTPITKYVTRCYLWFWAGLVVTLAVALLTDMTSPAVTVCSTLTSWTPTVVIFATFQTLFPGQKKKEWLTSQFSQKIHPFFFVVPFVVVSVLSFGALFLTEGTALARLKTVLVPGKVAATAFSALITGALGEELGWRGFLQPAIEQKNGGRVIKSAFLVGLIWSFWHTPLWFVTLGLPWNLLPFYIIGFVAANISFSIIIAVCYSHCRNIAVPMWIHFCFNFISNLIIAVFDLTTEQRNMVLWFCLMAAFSAAAAACFALWHVRGEKNAV